MKIPPPGLARRLRTASTSELMALVSDHVRHFTLKEVRQLLANPYATGEVIEELAVARHLLAVYEVRRALARHHRTPEPVALRLVSGLFWRDLSEVSLDVRIRPAVRRVAEKYLVQRLGRLAVGEKISLARRATPAVLSHLSQEGNVRVIRALLESSRLTEQVLVRLAGQSDSPRILELVARDPRWGSRYEIRVALARNTASPFRVILAILPKLALKELESVAGDEAHSSVVRHRAQDLLETRRSRPSVAIDPRASLE